MDSNGNGIFDVQEDIEAVTEMNEFLPQIWEGLESHRRAVRWSTLNGSPSYFISATDENHGGVTLDPGERIQRTLRILGNNQYRLYTLVYGHQASGSVEVCLTSPDSCRVFTTGSGWTRLVFNETFMTARAIRIRSANGVHSVGAVTAAQVGAPHRFLTHDDRMLWRKSGNRNGLFLPIGKDGSDQIDFALVAERQQKVWTDYSALSTGDHQVCFDFRSDARVDDGVGTGWVDIAGQWVNFQVTQNWQNRCVQVPNVPLTSWLGFYAEHVAFLVDNVTVTPL